MSKFWIPSTKRELVSWLSKRFNGQATGFKKMDKKQLYAIYFRARQGE